MNPVTHSIFALTLLLGPPADEPPADQPLFAEADGLEQPSYEGALEQLSYGVTIGDVQPKEAIAILEGALKVLPQFTPQLANDPEALALRAEAYVSLGRAYLDNRDKAKASAALDEGLRSAPFGQDLPATVYGPTVESLWKRKLKEIEGLPRREVVVQCWVECNIYLNERIVETSEDDVFAVQAQFEVLNAGTYRLWVEAADGSSEALITELEPGDPGDPPLEFVYGTKPEPEPEPEGPALAPAKPPPPVDPGPKPKKRMLPRAAEISAIAAGVGLIASGVALFMINGQCANDAASKDAQPSDGRELCPSVWATDVAGIALMASGAGLTAAGSILLGFDEVRVGNDKKAARITVGWTFRF